MTKLWIAVAPLAAALAALPGCEGADNRAGAPDGDSDSDSDGDSDSDSDSDSDGDTDVSGPSSTLRGTVWSPSGAFPISGALVYVTDGDAYVIEDNAYCYECDDMTGKIWTLSEADGSWTLENVPAGTTNIVTRKGFFQRQREIVVEPDSVIDVPAETTTLPDADSGDGLDVIPNWAVLQSGPDYPEDLLAKMGLGSLTSSGSIDTSQPYQFDLYDDYGSPISSSASAQIFSSAAYVNHYHMLFFPCINSGMQASNNLAILTQYVAAGGKIYSSCWAGQWVERPFPEVIDFNGDDTTSYPGNVSSYETHGFINDEQMRNWLAVVLGLTGVAEPLAGGETLDNFPFSGAWINIDALTAGAYEGHGLDDPEDPDDDNGWVIPKVWATDLGSSVSAAGDPLTLTFNYDCGKVFYSSYQVVEYATSALIRPQEWVLIYLFLEVGVCEGDYIPPE